MTITNGYITADEAQAYVGTQASANVTLLEETVTAVSRAIDGYCDRHFYQQEATARVFDSTDGTTILLGAFNDLVSVTAVKTDTGLDGLFATTIAASGYQLGPVNRSGPEARPYTHIRRIGSTWPSRDERTGLVQITGTWGWPAIPAAVKQACFIQTSRVFKRAESPLGVAGFGEFGVVRVTQLDPDVRALLAPYVLHAGFA